MAAMEAGAALHLRLSDGSTRAGAVLFAHDPVSGTRFIVNPGPGGAWRAYFGAAAHAGHKSMDLRIDGAK